MELIRIPANRVMIGDKIDGKMVEGILPAGKYVVLEFDWNNAKLCFNEETVEVWR